MSAGAEPPPGDGSAGTAPGLLEGIRKEAEELRLGGRIPAGFEERLDATWAELAADPSSLAGGGADLPERAAGASFSARSELEVVADRARRVGRAAARRARATAGPTVRAARHRAGELIGRAGEQGATRWEVGLERARLAARADPTMRRFVAHFPLARAFEPPRGRQSTAPGADLEDWVLDHVARPSASGRAVHVECGSGELLGRLERAGFAAFGADPSAGGAPPDVRVARAGALGYLGGLERSSLEALVLTGVTETLSPRAARALVHLASTRLRPGGRLAVLSARPGVLEASDPVRADLTPGRPLHPVTWCHLLARYGFSEVTVRDEGGPTYAVAARKQ